MILKKRLLSILVAVLMIFAMMPMSAGTVYAEADPDVTPPVITLDNFTLSLPDGKDKATVGDTITATAEVTDDRYVKYVNINLHSPVTGASRRIDLEYTGTDKTRSGIWTGTYTITDEDENGIWKIEHISTDDGQNDAVYSNNNVYSWGNADLSAYDFEVVAPECPADLTTSGYSMMLDGAGATSTFGGNYYVNTADETVTPTVKVRFDAEDGTWTTLSLRKYTLKYEKKTGENIWEDYTADTFGVNENGIATYRVSATGKESLYYTGTVGPVEFNVTKKAKVTFDTRGGSSIDPQYVIPGEKVAKPDDPAKSGCRFTGWYADPEMSQGYDFTQPVSEDITVYARWLEPFVVTFEMNGGTGEMDPVNVFAGEEFSIPECTFNAPEGKVFWRWNTLPEGTTGNYGTWYDPGDKITLTEDLTLYARWSEPMLSICSYDMTRQKSMLGGKFTDIRGGGDTSYGCNNYTVQLGDEYSVTAVPDDGYEFVGWYKGEYISEDAQGNPTQDARPYQDDGSLLTNDLTYSFTVTDNTVLCPVFKKTETEPQPAAQTITASNLTKTYGNAAFSLGAKTNGDGTLTYKSSNTKVATVDNAGKVTIKGAGTAKITISASATANFKAASKTITVTVKQAANPLKISAKTATVKYKKLKKKTQTLAVTKVIKFTKKLNDKKTYTLVSAKKGSKSFKKYFKVNKTTGKVTIKKNSKMKKGTYKVKVKVKALGNTNYKASGTKTVTFKVKVK